MTANTPVPTPGLVWNGPYMTWDKACIAAPDRGDAFLSTRWLERIVQQLQEFRNTLKMKGVALPPRPCNLPLVCSLTRSRSIVDFGGSSGWGYDYLSSILANAEISSYVIVEIEHIVEYMKRSSLHSMPVEYKTIKEPMSPCDLLYCNSVLQYFESNASFVKLIKKVRPRYILLDDLVANGVADFFATQNYYETAIPYRFLGIETLLSDLSAVGYELLSSEPYASPILGAIQELPMENFPESFRLRHTLSAAFRRKAIT
jgi:putative methyltransferase (TIGR04325 family)